ncbi:MAG: CRISPR-associated endonuclease Cas2 [Anaerolineae bacterium]|nr:CRISPR-associated endonuclease Cas2 [Anaerolineae bacterium]MDW8070880.1 CRISPR-associated endonuclease Cas2 [Anaerolineae bacterium]
MFILVSYDIPDDRRRTRLAKVLQDYGERVQYSVFECDLTQKQLQQLLREVKRLISEAQDSVRVYVLCQECVQRIMVLGQAKPPVEEPTVFIV